MNPPGYIGQWGDWRYYKLENRNGTVLRINLTWEGADTDLDMYLFGPDGGVYGLSGEGDSEGEYIALTGLVYPEYWVAVYAFYIAPDRIDYHIMVSYASSIRLEPASWRGVIRKGETSMLNYTVINDASADTDLDIEAVMEKNLENQRITGTIAHTGSDSYALAWKKSTSGLDMEGVQYMNASVTWGNPSKDINMYFLYKDESIWNTTGYMSVHRSDLLGVGLEDIFNADIKYYLDMFPDVGIGLSNPGTSQAYTLVLNFSGEGTCSYATPDKTGIKDLPASGQKTFHVSVNTSSLTAGASYGYDVVIKENGRVIARSPARITVTDAGETTTTSTTTASTSSSAGTTQTTATTSSTTSTTQSSCTLAGDYEPCGYVHLQEVVAYISRWSQGEAELKDVVALITAWAAS